MTISLKARNAFRLHSVMLLIVSIVFFLAGIGLIVHAKQISDITFALLGALAWGAAVFSALWACLSWAGGAQRT